MIVAHKDHARTSLARPGQGLAIALQAALDSGSPRMNPPRLLRGCWVSPRVMQVRHGR